MDPRGIEQRLDQMVDQLDRLDRSLPRRLTRAWAEAVTFGSV